MFSLFLIAVLIVIGFLAYRFFKNANGILGIMIIIMLPIIIAISTICDLSLLSTGALSFFMGLIFLMWVNSRTPQ
jgi:hypothetical protein